MNPPSTAGTLDPRTQRTREVVLRATANLLAEAGFERITIEAIAERSGVARSTVYRNWPDRAELLVQGWELLCAEPVRPDTGSVAGDLGAIGVELADGLANCDWGRAVSSLVGAVANDPDLRRAMQLVGSRRRASLSSALTRGIERGEVDAETDVDAMAELFAARFFYRHLMTGGVLDDAFVDAQVRAVIALAAPSSATRRRSASG